MKPAEFAAQLISRLESLKRKRDTISSLEERLQQIQEVGAAPSRAQGVWVGLANVAFAFA